jgi:hypothetical protein
MNRNMPLYLALIAAFVCTLGLASIDAHAQANGCDPRISTCK